MTYFLIVLVVFVALAPLISMKPSRRQRHIANLRQQAAISGMSVQLRELPGAAGGGELLPFYSRHRQRGDRKVLRSTIYKRGDASWQSSAGAASAQLAELFTRLPSGVSHVCENPQTVGIFWDERGETGDVEVVSAVLQQLLEREGLQDN